MKEVQDHNPFSSRNMALEEGQGLFAEALKNDWKHWVKEQLRRIDHNEVRGVELMEKFCGQSGPTIFRLKSRLQSEIKIQVDHTDDQDLLPAVRAVKIGPYHRNCQHLVKFNSDYKWKIVRYMVRERSFDPISFVEEMETEKEEIARKCYDDNFPKMDSGEFRQMLLLDSAFIVFVLDAFGNRDLHSTENLMDYMGLHIEVSASMKQIKLDFLMLDNQIPFFAIKQLYAAIGGITNRFDDLVLSFFDDLHPRRNPNRRITNHSGYSEFHHLLHVFHWSRVPEGKYGMDSDLWVPEEEQVADIRLQQYLYIPSAKELLKSSTIFRKKTMGCLLDITFKHRSTEIWAEMNIPTLHLYDYSRHIFSNLIAFETNYTGNGRCVMAYSTCMSRILQNEDDVKLLRRRGILHGEHKL